MTHVVLSLHILRHPAPVNYSKLICDGSSPPAYTEQEERKGARAQRTIISLCSFKIQFKDQAGLTI